MSTLSAADPALPEGFRRVAEALAALTGAPVEDVTA